MSSIFAEMAMSTKCSKAHPDTHVSQHTHRRSAGSRHRNIPSTLALTPTQHNTLATEPTSPVFEMSPLSPEFPVFSFTGSAPLPIEQRNKLADHEPLKYMYSFPTIRGINSNDLLDPSGGTLDHVQQVPWSDVDTGISLLRTPINIPQQSNFRSSVRPENLDYGSASSPGAPTKIIGFLPTIQEQLPSNFGLKKQALPPPRKMSYSCSPWLYPGKAGSDGTDKEESPLSMDFNDIDFKWHLLKRIDSQRGC